MTFADLIRLLGLVIVLVLFPWFNIQHIVESIREKKMIKNLRAIMNDSGTYVTDVSKVPVRCVVNSPQVVSKAERDFVLVMGVEGNPFGRKETIRARSSIEAGAKIIEMGIIPFGYVAHELIDPADKGCDKVGMVPASTT